MISRCVLRKLAFFRAATQQVKQCSTSGGEPEFVGVRSNFTDKIQFVTKDSNKPIPIYRILQPSGQARLPEEHKLDDETSVKIYHNMVTLNLMDKILYESQRQGRISFYMTNTGEEGTQIGSAAALQPEDFIYAQYREAGVLLWRGYSLLEFMNQCYGNRDDPGKGRQMPVHYGSKKLNFVTISSPLTTQLPQAVGTAYTFKRDKSKRCAVCYFGEGAASEGDAHAAFNFAATLNCPVIFICRNNGYAISTPVHEQLKGDGIAARGPAYGIHTIRVDGNDVLAVHHATKVAREYCVENQRPVLIESMTYRIGHHSTSDDSSAYRSQDEISQWISRTPTKKFRDYLESLNLWSEEREEEFTKSCRKEILDAFAKAEKTLKPSWKELFTDVYCEMPEHIRKQLSSMENHIKEFPEHYPLQVYKSS